MPKNLSQPELYRCPLCKRGLPLGADTLARHVRITHGWKMSATDHENMINGKVADIPVGVTPLPKLELVTRSPRQLLEWGRCDLCSEASTRRWLFEKTTRGEIILCANCRGRKARKTKVDALDSWARLPGNYRG